MKYFISFSFVFALFVAPLSVSASNESELLTAFEATFSNDFGAKASSRLTFAVDDDTIVTATTATEYTNRNKDSESHSDFTVDFDTLLLSSLFSQPIPAFAGALRLGSDSFYNSTNKYLWTRLRDLDLQITQDNSDANIKVMAEGFFEIAKFFSDKYVVIDFADALAAMTSDSSAVKMLREQIEASLALYDDYGKFATDALRITLASGLLEVSKSNGQYQIGLTNNPTSIQLEKLTEFLVLLGMTEDDLVQAKAELQAANAKLVEMWPEIKKQLQFVIRINTTPLKISSMSTNITLQLDHDITEFDESTWEMTVTDTVPLTIAATGNLMITDLPGRVVFPAVTSVVDFTKLLKAIAASLEMQTMSAVSEENFEVSEPVDDEISDL